MNTLHKFIVLCILCCLSVMNGHAQTDCCNLVLSTTPRLVSTGGNPFQCCYAIDVRLHNNYSSCLHMVTIQTYNGSSWVDGSTTPISSASFSILRCVSAGITQQVRLVFKDANGTTVCITQQLTLACDCCFAISNLQAVSIPENECCFRVSGFILQPFVCPITNYIIEQYQPATGTWSPLLAGIPASNGYFENIICIPTNSVSKIRIHFRDGINTVCTRELLLNCLVTGGLGKMRAGTGLDNLQQKVYAVPNPAIDETTVHYTLRETSDVRFSLYNMLGEMVIEIQTSQVSAGDQTMSIPTSELASGMYFMQVQAGSGVVTIPITIVK
jgi:hypothetical protein